MRRGEHAENGALEGCLGLKIHSNHSALGQHNKNLRDSPNITKICVIPLRPREEFTLIQEHAEILHNTNAPVVPISKLPVVAQTVSYMLGIDRSVRPGSAAGFKSRLIR